MERRTKKVQGCVVIGNGAAEVIDLAALGIQSGLTPRDLERLFLVHPSVSVALQRCAKKFGLSLAGQQPMEVLLPGRKII